jgi:hypothetical protein
MITLLDGETQTCEKCGRSGGRTYTFRYGKTLSEEAGVGVRRVQFGVAGTVAVAACDRCVTRYAALNGIALFVASVALGVFSVTFYAYEPGGATHPLLQVAVVFTGLFCLALSALFIKRVFSGRTTQGENLAIFMKKRDLQKQGFDQFWNSDQFFELESGRVPTL